MSKNVQVRRFMKIRDNTSKELLSSYTGLGSSPFIRSIPDRTIKQIKVCGNCDHLSFDRKGIYTTTRIGATPPREVFILFSFKVKEPGRCYH